MPQLIAFYLPQFHPVKENDEWWGKGFTEWTNTAKAQPLFRGHYQPHIPADLGFYDLRNPETRIAQAKMAKDYGIDAFCYYHYWFAGRRILSRPFDEVLASESPDFPFCLCWANQTWSGIWHGCPDRVLMEQTYPGDDDHRAHFAALLPAFCDRRYLCVDGKPIFMFFAPRDVPNVAETIRLWRHMAEAAGLPGLHLVANTHEDDVAELKSLGYDGVTRTPIFKSRRWDKTWRNPVRRFSVTLEHRLGRPTVVSYESLCAESVAIWEKQTTYPCVVHAWDNTPRSGRNGVVYTNSTPELFRNLLASAFDAVGERAAADQLIFLKSWNEWAEGNHLEPDLRNGTAYLQVVSDIVNETRQTSRYKINLLPDCNMTTDAFTSYD